MNNEKSQVDTRTQSQTRSLSNSNRLKINIILMNNVPKRFARVGNIGQSGELFK